MTDRTDLTPPVEHAAEASSLTHAGEAAETASAAPPKAPESSERYTVPATPRRGDGRWIVVVCTLFALAAAAVTLVAPSLRPVLADQADSWFGRGNTVSWLVASGADTAWHAARDEALHTIDTRLTDSAARIDRMAADQQATAADLARTNAMLRTDHASNGMLARTVEELVRQTTELRAATTALDLRTRAAGLLAMSLRLRRDIDAGLPIGRDQAALAAAGPYPASIQRALQQLRGLNDGAPTMRDLADAFDPLMARMVARSTAGTSWASRGWSRVTTLFGGIAPGGDAAMLDRLRSLAADGRFSEASEVIEVSAYADLGRDWIAQVHARAAAVLGAQAVLSYALTAYEDAYSAQAADAGGKPTQ